MGLDEGASPLELIVRKVTRAYPVPAWSSGQIALWLEMLADLDVVMLAQVAAEWIKARSERPTIADIRKRVADKQLGNAMGERLFMQQDEAWGYVYASISRVGRYRDSPTITRS